MTQAKFVVPEKGTARVIIKTNNQDVLPTFELDWVMNKTDATDLMVYAMQLKVQRDKFERRNK